MKKKDVNYKVANFILPETIFCGKGTWCKREDYKDV